MGLMRLEIERHLNTCKTRVMFALLKSGVIALNGSPFQSYGASSTIWDHTVLLAPRHRWKRWL